MHDLQFLSKSTKYNCKALSGTSEANRDLVPHPTIVLSYFERNVWFSTYSVSSLFFFPGTILNPISSLGRNVAENFIWPCVVKSDLVRTTDTVRRAPPPPPGYGLFEANIIRPVAVQWPTSECDKYARTRVDTYCAVIAAPPRRTRAEHIATVRYTVVRRSIGIYVRYVSTGHVLCPNFIGPTSSRTILSRKALLGRRVTARFIKFPPRSIRPPYVDRAPRGTTVTLNRRGRLYGLEMLSNVFYPDLSWTN